MNSIFVIKNYNLTDKFLGSFFPVELCFPEYQFSKPTVKWKTQLSATTIWIFNCVHLSIPVFQAYQVSGVILRLFQRIYLIELANNVSKER